MGSARIRIRGVMMTERKCPFNEPFCHAGCALWEDGKTCLERVIGALGVVSREPVAVITVPQGDPPVVEKRARRRKGKDGNSEQV